MESREALRDAIVARLTAEQSALRDGGVALMVDALLDEPVSAWIERDALVELITEALRGDNVRRLQQAHLARTRASLRAMWQASGETPGHGLTGNARLKLEKTVGGDDFPHFRWAYSAVDPALVRQLLAPVLQEILIRFARKLPLPGRGAAAGADAAEAEPAGGAFGGLRSRLRAGVSRRAERVAAAGKSVLDNLGVDVEERIQAIAREFSESALEEVRGTFSARLKSDEGRALLAKLRVGLAEAFLDTPWIDLARDLDRLPGEELDAFVALVLDHNRTRGPIQEALRAELDGWLGVEGARSVREVLDEAGLLASTRRMACAQGDAMARRLLGSDAFRAWLDDALSTPTE